MKTIKIMLASLLFMTFSGCNGQTKKSNEQLLSDKSKLNILKEGAENKPKIDVKVNKQYDDKGRMVKFDSTYTYFYSGPHGSMQIGNDSVFNNFRSFFDKSYPDYINHKNDNVFFNDSLFKYDFFNDNYFQKRFELNEKMFKNMFQQMDSIKREYLNQKYPDGYQKKKTK